MKTYYYNVYGLTLESEIELPELTEKGISGSDVSIKIGAVPNQLSGTKSTGILYEIANNDFLFKLENIAKYRVQDGTNITIQPADGAESKEIRLFLLGSVIGALLHQKGIFVLHGSAVANKNIATIFTGVSSSGKSSVAAGLYQAGYSFISDDVSVITFKDDNSCYVHPGIPQYKLWKDVLIHLQYKEQLEKVRPTLEKYVLPITHSLNHSPVLVKNIISLSAKNSPDYSFQELLGMKKYNLLRRNTYRLQYLNKMNKLSVQFNQLSLLSNITKVYSLERPASPIQLKSITEFIVNEIL